jgi:hypothetical protein
MITITIFHNVARDRGGRPTGMLDGYRPGDPVVRVFTYQADPAGPRPGADRRRGVRHLQRPPARHPRRPDPPLLRARTAVAVLPRKSPVLRQVVLHPPNSRVAVEARGRAMLYARLNRDGRMRPYRPRTQPALRRSKTKSVSQTRPTFIDTALAGLALRPGAAGRGHVERAAR